MIRNVTFYDVLTALGDLIIPRECIVCGRPLALRERHLCIGCLADLPRTYFSNMPHNQLADRFNALIHIPVLLPLPDRLQADHPEAEISFRLCRRPLFRLDAGP